MHTIPRTVSTLLTALFVMAGATLSALAASEFEGTWKVKDTGGKPFEIILSGDGAAKANREGEGMVGTWKEDANSATITWNTGWTTTISKDGDGYKKSAYGKDQPRDGKPASTSEARKAK